VRPSMRKIDARKKSKKESRLSRSSNKNRMRLNIWWMILMRATLKIQPMILKEATIAKKETVKVRRADIEEFFHSKMALLFTNGVTL
jgi:hypothetical protein